MVRHILLAACAALYPVSSSADVTVANATFEQPDAGGIYEYNPSATGVIFNNGSGVATYGSAWGFAPSPDGSQVAFIQNYPYWSGRIAMEATGLTAGDQYAVSFYLAQREGYGINPVTVSVDSGGVTDLGVFTPVSTDFRQFTTNAAFTATGSTAILTFAGMATGWGDFDTGLDAVSVSAVTSVPEPASWAMMIIGFLVVGAFARSRGRALLRPA